MEVTLLGRRCKGPSSSPSRVSANGSVSSVILSLLPAGFPRSAFGHCDPGIFFPPSTSRFKEKEPANANMTAVGSMVFCTDCGNLLPATKGSQKNKLQCECCSQWNKGSFRPVPQSTSVLI